MLPTTKRSKSATAEPKLYFNLEPYVLPILNQLSSKTGQAFCTQNSTGKISANRGLMMSFFGDQLKASYLYGLVKDSIRLQKGLQKTAIHRMLSRFQKLVVVTRDYPQFQGLEVYLAQIEAALVSLTRETVILLPATTSLAIPQPYPDPIGEGDFDYPY